MHTRPQLTTDLGARHGNLALVNDSMSPNHAYLDLESAWDGRATRITLRGEADLASAHDLEAGLAAVELDGTKRVELDISDLRFLDVAALRELTLFARRLRENGYEVKTYGAQPMVEQLVHLTGVHHDLGLV